jgi:hypothetical protein
MREYHLILRANKGEGGRLAFTSSIRLAEADKGDDASAVEYPFPDELTFRYALALIVGRDSAVDNVLTLLKANGNYDRLPKNLTIKQAQAFGWPHTDE